MSMAAEAAALVQERGAATVDDILPDMKGYTRVQVLRALKDARYAGLIDSDGWQPPTSGGTRLANRPHRATGQPRGSKPTTYRAIKKTARPRVSSVWDLAGMPA